MITNTSKTKNAWFALSVRHVELRFWFVSEVTFLLRLAREYYVSGLACDRPIFDVAVFFPWILPQKWQHPNSMPYINVIRF
jgi:hypothetical protein